MPSSVEHTSFGTAEAYAPTSTVLSGEWSVGRAAELLALAKGWIATGNDVTLDCSRLERLDLAAIQIVLAARRKSVSNGHAFRLDGLPSNVADTIRFTGLSELLS